MNEEKDTHLFCHRCGGVLTPGEGNFYVARIEAFADPAPPNISNEDGQLDLNEEFSKVLEEMRGLSERELMDQVYRCLTIHLCGLCYKVWIENPAG